MVRVRLHDFAPLESRGLRPFGRRESRMSFKRQFHRTAQLGSRSAADASERSTNNPPVATISGSPRRL
jgi:hypothetical protein